MNKRLLSLSLLSLSPLYLAIADARAADNLNDAIQQGKVSLQERVRFEWVNDDAGNVDPAQAVTVRSVLGYKTAPLYGVTSYLEYEDVHALDDKYNVPVLQPDPTRATVVDPEHSGIHQAWLSGYGFKVGEQKLIFNNERFIGNADWRQNDQVFDALSYERSRLLGWLDVQAAYATKVRLLNSQLGDIHMPVVNLRAHLPYAGATLTAFWAGLGGQEPAGTPTTAGLISNLASDVGRQYRVLRLEGKTDSHIVYDFSYGQQSRYDDGVSGKVPDAVYRDIQVGYDFGPVVVRLQQENLTNGFQTPLATEHPFNGWADRFLVTPTGGLVDRAIKFNGSAAGCKMALELHRFDASGNSMHYGNEVDASISRPLLKNLTGMLKMAHYEGSGVVPGASTAANIAYGKDLTKAWVQLDYKF